MKRIQLSHGAGGKAMNHLIKEFILKNFKNERAEVPLHALDDSAVINGVVFTTDSHTVQPIFFPGGDIGKLAVAGTINDISAMGAKPIALSSAMVIEEGFLLDNFEKIVKSMADVANEAGVEIITGDTKVVEYGGIKDIVVTTSAIGIESEWMEKNFEIAGRRKNWLVDSSLKPGDKIIINGSIAEHGLAIISKREGYGFEGDIKSDVAPLNSLVEEALKEGGIISAKDATRGGIANALNEMAEKSRVGILIHEEKIPLNEAVISACEMLGLDPLSIGNEGKMIFGVIPEKAEDVLKRIKKHRYGKDAEIIGEVVEGKHVVMETSVGGKRIIDAPVGDPIPRIC
ncbi:MAG TPA: hydrogenase expression/formation protein HypE [Thermoplasmatales archaeon]|nr:hydrogenase expression/formation protein HypE [Thermoplasmatales archaeon]